MKKVSLLKPLLLLFALIVGSSSVWATDVTFNFADLASANDWNNGEAYTEITIAPITVKAVGGGNNGKYYTSDKTWRMYNGGTVQITAAAGYKVTAVTSNPTQTFTISDGAASLSLTETTKFKSITVTYTTETIVPVTGVTLDQPSLSIPVGESKTLTATVAPSNASNKDVTWSSNKESVATVVDGVVTGVSEGTATITVTTEDGGKTATCDVTVTAAPTAVVTLDFTSNTWGFPEGGTNKTTGTNSYTANGYTITLFGPTGNGYYYDTDANNLLIGKKDATLTLPAFAFNVKRIKVYGADGASGSVTFNVFVGDDAVSTQVTSSKVTQTFDIAADKQAEGTVYVIKVTNGYNMRISKIEIFGTKKVTIASSGYSTLASAYALDFANATPAGLEAYVASSVTASGVDLSAVTEAPASTGVILKGTAGTEYTIPFKASAAAVGTNKLHAAVTAYDCAANEVYILKDGLFHLVTGASTVPAGKAYLLASDVPSGARELTFNFGDETAIRSLTPTLSEGEGVWYDLSGRRVENPTKGIYIMNGKKVIFK